MSYPINVVFILTGLFIYCQAYTCSDKLPDCAAYTKSACQGPYVIWAYENCRAFCGLCRKECVNERSDCHEFGPGMCHAPYETWARQNCANYCGFCGPEYECLFTPWMDLTPCSKSCGGGTKTQVRSFTLVPKGTPLAEDCNNSLVNSTVCNLKACPTKPPPTPGKQVVGEIVPDVVKVVVPAVVAAATAEKLAETAAAEAAAAEAAAAEAAAAEAAAAAVAGETAAVVAGETAAVVAGETILEIALSVFSFFGKRDINDETRSFEDLVQSVLKRQNVD